MNERITIRIVKEHKSIISSIVAGFFYAVKKNIIYFCSISISYTSNFRTVQMKSPVSSNIWQFWKRKQN